MTRCSVPLHFYPSTMERSITWRATTKYWLTQDARLREDFHITTGLQPKDTDLIKYKSKMKAGYEKAGIPCARYHLISDLTSAQNFIREVGYP